MKGLPDSKIYEQELQYWPYLASWQKVLDYICQNTPQNGTLLDLMCGPGYLLGKVQLERRDILLKGVDLDKRYIPHAQKKYPQINFEPGDILSWKSIDKYDVVICTGSLHHIPYEQQEEAVKKMVSSVKSEGTVIVSDCYIDDYANEKERKIAAAKLGYEYLKATIKNGAPPSVIEPTIEILWNDVLMKEFKTSINKRSPIFDKFFNNVETIKTWPALKSEYGDYIHICRSKII